MTADLRLAIPAACAWVATAIVIGIPEAALPVAVACWLLGGCLAALALARRARWPAVVALAAAASALCCTSVALQAPERQPVALTAERTVTAAATLTQTLTPGEGPFRVTLDTITIGDAPVAGPVPVLAFGEHAEGRLGIGTRVEVSGRLVPSEPGDDVAFLLFTDAAPVMLAPPPGYLDWANNVRERFLDEATRLPGDGGALLAGLAIGDTTAVGAELDASMKTSSLSHLTAVSGANCAIVIGIIMAAGAALGMPRLLRVGASGVVLVAFVVLVTPQPSVLRAAVMAALVLAAVATGRPARGLPLLALAVLVLLVADPWLARTYAFVLSVLATGGLLLLAAPLARVLGRVLPHWLALVVAVPLAAQLACQPVLVLLDASLPTWGVVANLLAAPAAPLATVVGLAACLALVVAPALGSLLCQVAWIPSAWIAAVARFFAQAPAARLPWPEGVAGVALLLVVTTVVLLAVLGARFVRRWSAAVLVAVLVAYAGFQVVGALRRPSDWQIAACDVGQGDAVLVRSANRVALIDTGPDPEPLQECLQTLGVGRIDLLVLTHYDLDHVGGAQAVLGMVDQAIVGPSGGVDDDRLVARLRERGADVEQVSRGQGGMLGDLRWRVLWPPARLSGIEPGNEASVTLDFQPVGECVAGCLSSVFLGDLGAAAQQRLLAAVPLDRVQVVKVSHHGSADQYEPLYERLRATVGVVGVGADNGYGHPTADALGILERVGTTAERTDEHGLILLRPGADPGAVSVWTER
ncbi:MAG: ComEC/Rec2 family competence protein [Rhodoglobus sp.]|nr:ComEC/Rec2 family competence protein [Rhodoglobus sp.]